MAGAYKATPIRHLETETYTPPLDLYLNKRLADFERQLQQEVLEAGQGPGGPKKAPVSVVAEACHRVFGRFRRRRAGQAPRQGPQSPTAVETATATINHWASQGQGLGLRKPPSEQPRGGKRKKEKKRNGQGTDEALEWAWKER